MRIAFVADIHSNFVALEKLYMELLEIKVEEVVFLGDLITDFPYPNKTFRLLDKFSRAFKTYFIKGNREEYVLNTEDKYIPKRRLTSLNGSIYYTRRKMKNKDLDFINKLPLFLSLEYLNLPKILIAHATPFNTRECLLQGEQNTNTYITSLDYKYIVCGHSHRVINYEYQGKRLINPGSLGVFYNGTKQACYCIFTAQDNDWQIEQRYFEYDINTLKRAIIKSKLLTYGKTYTQSILDSLESGFADNEIFTRGIAKSENPTEEDFKDAYQKARGRK